MSTNNFKFENILIVLPDFNIYHNCEDLECDLECEESGNCIGFDDFGYDYYITDIQEQLEKIGFEYCGEYDNDRNYGGKIIAKWGLQDNDGMIKWLEVVVRSGYYDGANIDYIIDGDFGIENENNKKQVAHYEAMNRKFDRQVVKVEKILRANGTELLKVGQFSNGEALYKKK